MNASCIMEAVVEGENLTQELPTSSLKSGLVCGLAFVVLFSSSSSSCCVCILCVVKEIAIERSIVCFFFVSGRCCMFHPTQ